MGIRAFTFFIVFLALAFAGGSSYAKSNYIQFGGLNTEVIGRDDLRQTGNADSRFSNDRDLGVFVAIGTRVMARVRAEIEASVRRYEMQISANDNDRYYAKTAMGNVIFDIPVTTSVQPYIGGGAGYTYYGNDIGLGKKDNSAGFTYQGMAGMTFKFSELSSMNIGYRYFNAQIKPDSGTLALNNFDGDLTSHNIEISLRFAF
jgi:opacity protein-like surface antigen